MNIFFPRKNLVIGKSRDFKESFFFLFEYE